LPLIFWDLITHLSALAFGENLVLLANPSKSGGDWWYGTVVRDGKSGFFPKTYVEQLEISKYNSIFNPIILIVLQPKQLQYIHTQVAMPMSCPLMKAMNSPLSTRAKWIGGRQSREVLSSSSLLPTLKFQRVSSSGSLSLFVYIFTGKQAKVYFCFIFHVSLK
jgi:Variant SH3 domain